MKESNVKYVPYFLSDYIPVVGNYESLKNKVSSRYSVVQLPDEYWAMFTIKLPDYLI